MKGKITGILIMACVCILSIMVCPASAVTGEVEQVDENSMMSLSDDTLYRFEQLENSLKTQIACFRDVLGEISVSDELMCKLKDYVIRLESLLETVQNIDLTNSPEDLAYKYQSVEKEAGLINQEFKRIVYAVRESVEASPVSTVTTDEEFTEDSEITGLSDDTLYRFEQLEILLENQIAGAKDILGEISVSDEVMSELRSCVIRLVYLKEQVHETDLTETPENLAQKYQFIRSEADLINQKFKQILNTESMYSTTVCSTSAGTGEAELTEEIRRMVLPANAGDRFEQLEKSLENQIANARDILGEISVSDEVMGELKGYVIRLELLLERVKETDLKDTPKNLAAEFQSVKNEARSISHDFKTVLNSELKAEKIAELRETMAEKQDLKKAQAKAGTDEKKTDLNCEYDENKIKKTPVFEDTKGEVKAKHGVMSTESTTITK